MCMSPVAFHSVHCFQQNTAKYYRNLHRSIETIIWYISTCISRYTLLHPGPFDAYKMLYKLSCMKIIYSREYVHVCMCNCAYMNTITHAHTYMPITRHTY